MVCSFISSLFNALLPRYCVCCQGRLADGERLLCAACRASLSRRDDILSPCDNDTVRLFWGRVAVERAVAWTDYVPHSDFAEVIYSMKYRRRPDIAESLGRIAGGELLPHGFFDGIDMIVPLPLHTRRERERGYNQSHEFAVGLRRVTHLPVADGVVERTRYTPSQTGMSPEGRAQNVRGAFRLVEPLRVAGRHVLVVDDILTTGASLTACAEALAQADGVRLSFLTIGRTVG